MKRTLRVVALLTVLGVVAGACTKSSTSSTSPGASGAPQKGGTLRILQDSDFTHTLDPSIEYYNVPFEYFRCCLLRMLYSYNGEDQAHDGIKVFPDLATAAPDVSSDGLTYTVHLKQGLKYAPPLQNVTITAGDFIRAIERGYAVAGPYMGYYNIFEGASDYSEGKAKTISGIKAVDDYTLQFKLTEPVGDFEYRFALGGATSPIPPNPSNPSAQFGVATGHDNYGPFIVSTGPYMIRGSENVDFSLPPDKQKPATGYKTGRSLILVRNPSWKDDDLRPAYPDVIDGIIQPGAEGSVQEKAVQNDEADTVFSPGVAPETLQAFQSDPTLQHQIFFDPSAGNYYITMNLAVPPFDDLAVRKAVNFAVDKEGWRRFQGGETSGTIATHFTPDILLNDALKDYDYYATPNNAGADSPEGLTSAMNEMKKSKYDTNKDGICDASACSNVYTIGVVGTQAEAQTTLIASDLKKIGITLDVHNLENAAAYVKTEDPNAHVAMTTFAGWIQDYPDAYTFYWFQNYGGNITDQYNVIFTMIGATSAQLKKYGYKVTSVPGMDDTIKKCAAIPLGDARTQCWADADKVLNEQFAAYVPLIFSDVTSIVSSCVTNFSYDASNGSQAFDHMSVKPDCGKA